MAFKSVTPEAESGGDCGSDSWLLAEALSIEVAAAAAAAIDAARAEKGGVEGETQSFLVQASRRADECELRVVILRVWGFGESCYSCNRAESEEIRFAYLF